MDSYDLLVIGTGPAGIQAALRARRAGRSAAVVERMALVGGICIHRGTIPSKTLRQAVVDLSGFRYWGLYESGPPRRPIVQMDRIKERCEQVVMAEVNWQDRMLRARGVQVIRGHGRFVDPHTLLIEGEHGMRQARGDKILIAVGSVPVHPSNVPFDGRRVLDSDQILEIDEMPESVVVVGGGVIGSEYASIFSVLDVDVTLVSRGPELMPFVDETILSELRRQMESRGVTFVLGNELEHVAVEERGVRLTLSSGIEVRSDAILYCAGRRGVAGELDLEAAGLSADEHGRISVDSDFRTAVPHIYAAGDVIGFPSLASASREQGRVAACRALGVPCRPVETLLPFGVYTVPELAMIGLSEKDARARGLDVETGCGRYQDTARGQIIGDTSGLLKLVVDRDGGRLVGAHLIGTGASELVHMAQMAMAGGFPYTWFIRTVMNYPTLSRVYKTAAWEVLEKVES